MNQPRIDRRSGSIIRIFSKRFQADEGKKEKKKMKGEASRRANGIRRVPSTARGHEATKVKIREEKRAETRAFRGASGNVDTARPVTHSASQPASQPRP